MDRFTGWFTPSRRRRIYRVLLVSGPVLAAHSIVTADLWSLYVAVAAEVLGVSMAERNVPAEG